MNHRILIITFLSVAAFITACKPAGEKSAAGQSDIDTMAAKTKIEIKAAAPPEKEYAYAQKAEFVDKMQSQLADINRDLDQLSTKVESSSDPSRAEAKPKLQALRDKAALLNKQLDETKNATASTWDDVKAGTSKAYAEFKGSFQQSRQWLSDKIAP